MEFHMFIIIFVSMNTAKEMYAIYGIMLDFILKLT